MSWTVSPRQFVDIFHQVVGLRQEDLLRLWNDVKEYSAMVLKGPDCILEQVAGGLNVDYWGHQFLSCDAVYSPRDSRARVSVAIEHENAIYSAGWEVYKLAYVSAPLRVLITYPFNAKDDQRHLDNYCRILDGTGVQANGQLLLILASLVKPALETISWRYYLFAGSEFIPILPGRAVIVA